MKPQHTNIPERIERVRAHLKSRRGRRDLQARVHLVSLLDVLSGVPSTTTELLNKVIRTFYSEPPVESTALADHPLFSFIGVKKERGQMAGPPRYVQPVFIKDIAMPKYRCDDCDELVDITPNGADPEKTNKRQRLVLHPNKKKPGELCPGGGRDV